MLLGCVFLVEGRRSRNRSKEEDLFPPQLIQERELSGKLPLREIKAKK